ncbi:ketoacyl-synthetase C-terminal extension domain-containing protein [Solwaraspora sp. WMMB335]|uniref:ketoacyl-synthetase C-terminal extension domain-containing protein n=1 Tax=Solwaraspora sp. WMMB335 TaxID=3404118 RepID=UPI003B93997B
MLVLARAEDADAAGDQVLAVVRGTAVNNDGRSLSLLAPNPLRQQEVITQAYRDAGVDPAQVSYVEAHGTGTPLGDSVEVRSLAHAFAPRPDGTPRWLGSVKSNLGHLLTAAGMPSLVKVVLALAHRRLPPSLHLRTPSPRFDLAAAGFQVVSESQPWTGDGPLLAGVNAFGFGGTNAHAILQQAPAAPAAPGPTVMAAKPAGPRLLTVSTASKPALRQALAGLSAFVAGHPDIDFAQVCASVSTARDDRPYRLALIVGDDLAERLRTAATGPCTPVLRRPRAAYVRWPTLADGRPDEPLTATEYCRKLADWGIAMDPVAVNPVAADTGAELTGALRRLLDEGYDTLVTAAGQAAELDRAVRAMTAGRDYDRLAVIAADDDEAGLLALAGALWQRGAPLDRLRLAGDHRRLAVPTYPFQRRRHWPSPDPTMLVHQLVWSPSPPVTAGRTATSVCLVGHGAGRGNSLGDGLRAALRERGIPSTATVTQADLTVFLADPAPAGVPGSTAGTGSPQVTDGTGWPTVSDLDAEVTSTVLGFRQLLADLTQRRSGCWW